jgi:hypothetical protein
LADHEDCRLPSVPELAGFLFPEGAAAAANPDSDAAIAVSAHSFVLTNEEGVRSYAMVLRYYESVYFDKWVAMPRCLVALSHWPFLFTFEQYLSAVYVNSRRPSPFPFEAQIVSFASALPLPPRGDAIIQVRPLSLECIALLLKCVTLKQQAEPRRTSYVVRQVSRLLSVVQAYIGDPSLRCQVCRFVRPPEHGLPLLDIALTPVFDRFGVSQVNEWSTISANVQCAV